MERLLPAAIIVVVLLGLLALMLLGWRRRTRSQSALPLPSTVPSELGDALWRGEALYVATTRAGDQLDRVAVHGLGFRARGEVGVHPEGVVLALRGSDPVFIARDRVHGIGRATWAIDRVVEPGGLVVLDWLLDDVALDSYLRLSAERSAELLTAVQSLLAPTNPEGSLS